jgi:hypothetical protein
VLQQCRHGKYNPLREEARWDCYSNCRWQAVTALQLCCEEGAKRAEAAAVAGRQQQCCNGTGRGCNCSLRQAVL